MSNRPNYILELKDGRTIEFVPVGDESYRSKRGAWYSKDTLEDLGATPVPQEKPKVVYRLTFADDRCEWRTRSDCIPFKSHEDAENYRLRCESIGPEWTDWEPEHGQMCYCVTRSGGIGTDKWYDQPEYHLDKAHGFTHPTKERAQEWLEKFGKARGLK